MYRAYPLYPPPLEIKKIVKLIRESINLISDSLELTNPWSDQRMKQMLVEFVYLVTYQIEQIEGILCIAESNLYLYPSAFVICRTVLETNILIEWLLQPEEESERIIRYIRYLNSQLDYIDNHTNDIFNSDFPISQRKETHNNKDAIIKDIDDMKAAAINYGIREEDIPPVGLKTSKIPVMTGDNGMISQISDRQIDLRIAYYTLSKFSHGMRQSIYRYLDPNFEQKDPLHNWHYPLAIFTYIVPSIDRLIERFADNRKNQLTSNLISNLAPILSEFNMLMEEVFKDA
jgi:hypothetical protein